MIQERVRVKMCGMTREQDIAHAVSLGVDAIGLIFYTKSSRFISIESAKKLLQKIPLFVDVVAVTVNPDEDYVKRIMGELPIQYLQFHGSETPAFCEQFNKPYIKSVSASSTSVISNAMQSYPGAAALLLDTPSLKLHGGTGVTFDWKIIPEERSIPLILAGGLDANNVYSAISQSEPYAVDVCSGVEERAGIKDHTKMTHFINSVTSKNYE